MISRFLKAKHWQMFMLVYGLPLVFQSILLFSTFAEVSGNGRGASNVLFELYFTVFPFVTIIFTAVLLGWIYSIGVGLQKGIQEDLRRPTGLFKLAIIFPVIYILAIFAFVFSGMAMSFLSTSIGGFVVIVPLHLFAMFCMMYILYYAAKTLKTAELKRETSFTDFAGEFFLIWFFPIGIWFVQPKVNKLVQPVSSDLSEEDFV